MQISERRFPMAIMPVAKELKTFTETGTFGDGYRVDNSADDAQAAMLAARLQHDAIRMCKLDNGPQDRDPAPGQVWTADDKQCNFKGDASAPESLLYCAPTDNSTTFLSVGHLQNPARELVAFGAQSNLEFGGEPTKVVGFGMDTQARSYYTEKKTL